VASANLKKAKTDIVKQATAQNDLAIARMNASTTKGAYTQIKKEASAVKKSSPAIRRMQTTRLAAAKKAMDRA